MSTEVVIESAVSFSDITLVTSGCVFRLTVEVLQAVPTCYVVEQRSVLQGERARKHACLQFLYAASPLPSAMMS